MRYLIGFVDDLGNKFADYKYVEARKFYDCLTPGCGNRIQKGDTYRREIWRSQKVMFARRICSECCNKDL